MNVCVTVLSFMEVEVCRKLSKPWHYAGGRLEGDLGEIVSLGAEISPYIGLKEKLESS